MERTCSSVSQLLTATHTWPPHLLEKGWQSNLCAPGAVHGDEEATQLPWPLMVSVMKAEATVSFIERQAFTNSGRWFSNLREKNHLGGLPLWASGYDYAPNLGALGLIPAGN